MSLHRGRSSAGCTRPIGSPHRWHNHSPGTPTPTTLWLTDDGGRTWTTSTPFPAAHNPRAASPLSIYNFVPPAAHTGSLAPVEQVLVGGSQSPGPAPVREPPRRRSLYRRVRRLPRRYRPNTFQRGRSCWSVCGGTACRNLARKLCSATHARPPHNAWAHGVIRDRLNAGVAEPIPTSWVSMRPTAASTDPQSPASVIRLASSPPVKRPVQFRAANCGGGEGEARRTLARIRMQAPESALVSVKSPRRSGRIRSAKAASPWAV